MVAVNKDHDNDAQWQYEEIYGSYEPPKTSLRFDALYKSVEASYRGLEPFRNLNRNLIREYAGPAYGDSTQKRKYLNVTAMMVDAYMMMLAANRPRVEVTTRMQSLQAYAKHYSVGLNNLLEEIGLEFTVRRWVLDAFFSVGIVKVHRKSSREVEFENNIWMDPGTPFASNVSLDNFVYDMGAKSWGEVRWAGDMYRIPLDDIKAGVERGVYDPEVAESVVATSKYHVKDDRVEEFSRGNETDLDDFMPMVDLADIWIAREKKVYTFVVDKRSSFCIKKKPLASMDWLDTTSGPYHVLGFGDIPDNIMPVGPAVHMDELDRLINQIMRKQARQAMRQKDHVIFGPTSADTAKRMQKHPDGGMYAGDASAIANVSEGGANAANQQFLINLLDLYNRFSGNVETMLGLGAQSDTVGQEQLIHDASNRKVGAMQSRVMDATRRLISALAFELWNDQFMVIAGQIDVAGYQVDATLKPGDRAGNFWDYNFEPNVYSMSYRPPVQQADMLMSLMERVYMPLQQNIAMQGGIIDVAVLNEELASKLDADYLRNIIKFNNPPQTDEAKPSTGVQAPNTTRTYERVSKSAGPTGQARYAQMAQSWGEMGNQQGSTPGAQ